MQLDPIRVVFALPESDVVDLRRMLAEAAPGALPDVVFRLTLPNGDPYGQQGRLEYVAAEVDPHTGTVAVRLIFDNPEGLLAPGQYLTVIAGQAQPPMMPVVPQTAVLQDRVGQFVYQYDPATQTVQRRDIVTGPRVRSGWAVEQGLTGGEGIVVQGIQRLTDGATVNAAEGRPAPVPGEAPADAAPAANAQDGAN